MGDDDIKEWARQRLAKLMSPMQRAAQLGAPQSRTPLVEALRTVQPYQAPAAAPQPRGVSRTWGGPTVGPGGLPLPAGYEPSVGGRVAAETAAAVANPIADMALSARDLKQLLPAALAPGSLQIGGKNFAGGAVAGSALAATSFLTPLPRLGGVMDKLREPGAGGAARQPVTTEANPARISTADAARFADPNVPLDKLKQTERPYLDNLKRQIVSDGGIKSPITIRVRPDGTQHVYDGHHRIAIAQEMGWNDLPVRYTDMKGEPLPAPEEMVELTHYGEGALQDYIDPAFHGKGGGIPGAESKRKAAYPEEYEPRSYWYAGKHVPESNLGGMPSVKIQVPKSQLVQPEKLQSFADKAMKELSAEGKYLNEHTVISRMERLIKKEGFKGLVDQRGVAILFDKVPTGRAPKVKPQPVNVRSLADEFIAAKPELHGVYPDEPNYLELPENEGYAIADLYEKAPLMDDSPAVRASYDAFKRETKEQFDYLQSKGVRFEPWTGKGEPYKNSAEMVKDVNENGHLYFFTTDAGFGNGADVSAHPLLEDAGVELNGKKLVYNDLFRAVHDFFGHAKEGYQFGPRGEHNAWGMHSAMYSPTARGAMGWETRGQNSWVNFGPHLRDAKGKVPGKDQPGYKALPERPFADQKVGILPEQYQVIQGGALPMNATARQRADARAFAARQGPAREAVVKEIEEVLSPSELQRFHAMKGDARERTIDAYLKGPTPRAFASAALQGANARGWYKASGESLYEAFDTDAPRFAALLAATSPQKSVDANLQMALDLWEKWNRAGRPTDEYEIQKLFPDDIMQSDAQNAVRALQASEQRLLDPDTPGLLSGMKVDPFWSNLMGETQRVVHDTHMATGYGTKPKGIEKISRNLAMTAMVKRTAKEIEKLTGQVIDPREAQEMAWAFIRGLKNAADLPGVSNHAKGDLLATLEAALKDPKTVAPSGRTLHDEVNDAVPFATLLRKHAEAVERAGGVVPAERKLEGLAGADPSMIRKRDLRDIAERISAVRKGEPFFVGAGLLGAGAARDRQRREQ